MEDNSRPRATTKCGTDVRPSPQELPGQAAKVAITIIYTRRSHG